MSAAAWIRCPGRIAWTATLGAWKLTVERRGGSFFTAWVDGPARSVSLPTRLSLSEAKTEAETFAAANAS